jgi:hypothetical protein
MTNSKNLPNHRTVLDQSGRYITGTIIKKTILSLFLLSLNGQVFCHPFCDSTL